MDTIQITARYANVIRNLPRTDFDTDFKSLPDPLLMEREGELAVYYAPFDYVNTGARVVLVGITPGIQQATNAARSLHDCLQQGLDLPEALRTAKHVGAFSGPMRNNLINLLDSIGLNRKLGLASSAMLWNGNGALFHTTSMLRYPVLLEGRNYNGAPAVQSSSLLERCFRTGFAREVEQLPHAVFVPLGPKVEAQLQRLVREGVIDDARVLDGLPHPSGANAERIAYWLGRKAREQLSGRTNATKLDTARAKLNAKVERLPQLA